MHAVSPVKTKTTCGRMKPITISEEREFGKFPNFNREFFPVQCQHCDNPPCVSVCPTGASHKRKDGVVLVDEKDCIGCKYCIAACPYNVRIIKKEGYIEKCRFCIEFVEEGGKPACMTTCMTGVRLFGDLDDPQSDIAQFIAKNGHRLRVYKREMNTKPRIFYRKA